jgi:hypothetical protein
VTGFRWKFCRLQARENTGLARGSRNGWSSASPRTRLRNGAARGGNARWRRLTEERAGGAKSVFHFDVQGSWRNPPMPAFPGCASSASGSAPASTSGRSTAGTFRAGRSAIAEVYPALWSRGFAAEGRTCDQHDAFSIAAWLSRADRDDSLAAFLNPDLWPPERTMAQVEGWILGVAGLIRSAKGRDDSAMTDACDPNVFRLH